MKYIAHRGLTEGPSKELENNPSQLIKTISQGYYVEVDAWFVDGEWMLGHDEPTYGVNQSFLDNEYMYVHAKNIDALHLLVQHRMSSKYFWHQDDDCVLTSNGYIWTYPGKQLTPSSIMVMPEYVDSTLANTEGVDCYGICSDYVAFLSNK